MILCRAAPNDEGFWAFGGAPADGVGDVRGRGEIC